LCATEEQKKKTWVDCIAGTAVGLDVDTSTLRTEKYGKRNVLINYIELIFNTE